MWLLPYGVASQESQSQRKIDWTFLRFGVMYGEEEMKTMKITEIPAREKARQNTRVAAYARVSSDKDAAFQSLEAQTAYYKDYVAEHPDWELVGIYSDNGISGTLVERPEFQRLLEDCRVGKVDLVITKSVTRFARNTVILLKTVRELKELGIDCYFEKENMHSISPDGELLLTLLAMYAEEEARSASENQKWRIRKKFENGEPWVGNMLGYRLIDGKMVIVPKEAEIVRQIFTDYLSGKGSCTIAKNLILEGVEVENGNKWTEQSIRKILKNEKYTGNMVLQKTYRPDFRTKKSIDNRNKVRKFFVEDSHEAIIDQETFDLVQAEMCSRAVKNTKTAGRARHIFCGMIRCGNCGRYFKYYRTNRKKYDQAIWACPNFYSLGKAICPSQKIPEEILLEKTREILGVTDLNRESIAERIKEIIVPAPYTLRFILVDGTVSEITWQHRSRKESWTPEMRQKAREKTLARHRKEEDHAESNNH